MSQMGSNGNMDERKVRHVTSFHYMCILYGIQFFAHTILPRICLSEISSVGESEESCRGKKIPCEVGRARYANNARGQIAGDTHGLLKLVFHRETRQLLGVHIIGENATELIHLGMSVLESGGKLDTFIELVFNYPTLSEMYKYAAYDGLGNLAGHKLREG